MGKHKLRQEVAALLKAKKIPLRLYRGKGKRIRASWLRQMKNVGA